MFLRILQVTVRISKVQSLKREKSVLDNKCLWIQLCTNRCSLHCCNTSLTSTEMKLEHFVVAPTHTYTDTKHRKVPSAPISPHVRLLNARCRLLAPPQGSPRPSAAQHITKHTSLWARGSPCLQRRHRRMLCPREPRATRAQQSVTPGSRWRWAVAPKTRAEGEKLSVVYPRTKCCCPSREPDGGHAPGCHPPRRGFGKALWCYSHTSCWRLLLSASDVVFGVISPEPTDLACSSRK